MAAKTVIPGLVPGTKVSATASIGPRDKPGDDEKGRPPPMSAPMGLVPRMTGGQQDRLHPPPLVRKSPSIEPRPGLP